MTNPRTTVLAAACLTTDGELTPLSLDPEHVLAGMYVAIGCRLVEAVDLSDRLTMWLDEEGICNAQINLPATLIAHRFGQTHQSFYGNAVFTGGTDPSGDTLPLNDDQLAWLMASFPA